jgi:hypothetical protein
MKLYATGAHKENHRGRNIYWAGTYNVEGDSSYRTLAAARAAIDRSLAEYQPRIPEGAMLATHEGNMVTVQTPDGPQTYTITTWRKIVFDLEAKYGRSIAFAR